jgi:uncharacterized membrane-anchored protein
MSEQVLAEILLRAKSENILPAEALAPAQDERPWPVLIVTAVGAWLAAIPLMLALGILIGGMIIQGGGVYIVGPMLIGLAVAILRNQTLPLFTEQLSVPALLTGCGLLAIGLYRDTRDPWASGLLVVLAAVLALVIARTWLRVLLGFTMVCLAAVPVLHGSFHEFGAFDVWLVLHACLAAWIVILAQIERGKGVALADAIEALGIGWVLAVLAGLAIWSGMTFLLGASIGQGGIGEGSASHDPTWRDGLIQTGSFALAACAAAWLAYRWPEMRRSVMGGVALVLLALAWLMPSLGGVLLVLAIGAVSKRWRIAIAAAVAATWIVGSFYYQLDFPFATKAFILTAAAAVLGAMAWLALRLHDTKDTKDTKGTKGTVSAAAAKEGWGAARIGIGTATLAALLVVNLGIWQNETLIARRPPIFVELAPVDPRSLMQGDFMRLRFILPSEPREQDRLAEGANRPHVVAHIDARGVATLKKMHDGSPLQANEILIELTSTRNGWTLASDAWYFKEGEATRWSRAKYGEFRVDSGGRALLVSMRGPALEAL